MACGLLGEINAIQCYVLFPELDAGSCVVLVCVTSSSVPHQESTNIYS